MSTALFATSRLMALVPQLALRAISGLGAKVRMPAAPRGTMAPACPSTSPLKTGAPPTKSVGPRVLRVYQIGAASAQGGRLFISGRMGDVCAELDRLAAREAASS